MNNQQLWQAALGELELTLSKVNFTTWFRGTAISSYENSRIIISVPSAFAKSWLQEKYHQSILKTLRKFTEGDIKEILYKVESAKKPFQSITVVTQEEEIEQPTYQTAPDTQRGYVNEFGLNEKYTFDNFIVGTNNELAHAASQAAANNPGKTYNPLFLYGGVGLGKTHLLQAVGNRILKANPHFKVLYASCEKFTNDFITAVKRGQANEFQNKYRSVDLLLIDDIQFITGKEGTQEAFFHTFNALHQSDKQIVITSDRPPKSIATLEKRLLSRFEWGMIADISHPDLETRIAILEAKCQAKNYELGNEVMQFMAENIQENVRELEGALNRIMAQHELQGLLPNIDSVRKMLAGIKVSGQKKAMTATDLLEIVIDFYGISMEDLLGASRKKTLVIPRQIVMYLLREEMRKSFPQIGEELGGRDHTTAMHACDKITRLLQEDEQIKQEISSIKQRMYSHAS